MTKAIRPASINCAHCGTEKKVARDGPIPTYCSGTCRASVKHERARTDGRHDRALAESRRRTLDRQIENARPCPYCGASMTHPRRKQCGQPECRRAFQAERMRTYMRAYRAETGERYAARYQPKPRRRAIKCAHCGQRAEVTKSSARYCSTRCWYDARRAEHSRVEMYRPKRQTLRIQVIIVRRSTTRRWYSARCPMCGTWFVSDNPRYRTCSLKCGRRAAKDRRRALEREAFVAHVNRNQVYERDQWTCQLCGQGVLRDEVVPHPQAPTLDHIIALSQGGTHEPANVQLAHFYCNTIKNDGEWQEAGRPPAPWE